MVLEGVTEAGEEVVVLAAAREAIMAVVEGLEGEGEVVQPNLHLPHEPSLTLEREGLMDVAGA